MSAAPHDLHTFMAQVSEEIASEYQRIYARSSQDPGTAGDEGESNWASVLKEWLPPYYHVETKGQILAADGSLSPQIDVLVLKPFYPRKLLEKKVWLADGVAAAFECKNTLKAAHVTASVSRCELFKSLYRPRIGTPYRELVSPLIYGILAHSHSWKGAGSKPIENVSNAFESAVGAVKHPRGLIDVVCIADLATWTSHLISYIDDGQSSPPVKSAFSCASAVSENQDASFRPVGTLLAGITRRLAWDDASIRPLADYYTAANMLGSGAGRMVHWPDSVYSNEVLSGIRGGRLNNGQAWSEWSLAIA